jgi:uncharacterized protein YbaA (DUF1428 family)
MNGPQSVRPILNLKKRTTMTGYADGFVIPIKKTKIAAYRRMAAKAAVVWRDHGALDYKECVGDDLSPQLGLPFPRGIKAKPGETVLFSWITYKSRRHRDQVNARVMKDPRLAEMCDPKNSPFDADRMLYGGFKVIVSN